MDGLLQDLAYSARQLARRPGFALVMILTLALGVGANAAVFSVVNGVLLRPLPYLEPARLAVVWTQFPNMQLTAFPSSAPEFWDYQDQNRAFETLGGYVTVQRTVTGGEEPESLEGAAFTFEVWDALGVAALLGRTFDAEDDRAGAEPVAVLGEDLWRRRFAADPGIVGRTLELDGTTTTVVGVMPRTFAFPETGTEVWLPMGLDPTDPPGRANHFLSMVGRLAPGMDGETAQADLQGLLARWEADTSIGHTWRGPGHPALIRPLQEEIVGDVRQSLIVLLGAVGVVLLIACANVANLLLVRGESRQRELSIRTALGADRRRILGLVVSESILIAVLGGVTGALLAFAGMRALLAVAPSDLPRAEQIGLDGTVLGFTALVVAVSCVLFGLAPALQSGRSNIQRSLRDEGRGGTVSRSRFRVRQLLVVSETALAVVLLIGAGLLIQSFRRLSSVEPGYLTEGLLTAALSLPETAYPDTADVVGFYQELMPRLASIPGVRSASAVRVPPLAGSLPPNDIEIEEREYPDDIPLNADIQVVDHDYFATLGVPVLRGRDFDPSDVTGGEFVAVIDEVLANRFFPDEDPIGLSIRQPGSEWSRIVGVVGGVHQEGLATEPRASLYLLHDQSPWTWYPVSAMTLVLSTALDPLSLVPAVRAEVQAMDPDLPLSDVSTMKSTLDASTSRERFSMLLQLVFAGIALMLAVVGIYGVLSYTVAQRTQEIGIRMALGAERGRILKLVVGQGMALVVVATFVGATIALAAGQVMASLLFGISPRDPLTYVTVTSTLVVAAFVACWIPARRASAVSPQTALRYD